ncbi:PEP-CTERM sorting domain-containing protein [Aquabacterium sp.]|uniref:PEP-CTERM sorting domain-containing protein n=1 Tax=Aquabacterium sp. TaxID=1872578 RepID=UPI0019A769BE|nr:PEP-CTERM sorting domain-containing protein [Aquabacterium sp.]MBC7701301.1 PEP-CTERM sorting domain-containing protein [Aquabacterium sp.]
MKTSFIRQALGIAALAMCAQTHAAVEAGHWRSATTAGNIGENFSVWVDQTIEGDYTGVFMNYTAGQLKGITFNVDEGAKLYVVKAGDVFTQASSALATNVFGSTPVPVGTDFYLAAKTRSYTDPGFSYDDSFYTSFGWAHFKVDALGKPQLLGSAMAFREGGIIVGTLQAVPEPGTWALMGLGLAALAWRTRSARQTTV